MWVSRHENGRSFWILMKQEMMEMQWHHLDHIQIICTLLKTVNQASSFSTGWTLFLTANQQ